MNSNSWVPVSNSGYYSSTLDKMLVDHRGTPSVQFAKYPFINLNGERNWESVVSSLITKHSDRVELGDYSKKSNKGKKFT